jgi:cell division GTPase FtsZ
MPIQVNEAPNQPNVLENNINQMLDSTSNIIEPTQTIIQTNNTKPIMNISEAIQNTTGKRQKRKVEIAILGCGGMGKNVLIALAESPLMRGIDNLTYIGINSDDDDLEQLEQCDYIHHIIEFGDGFGMGMNTQAGYESFKDSQVWETKLKPILDSKQAVIIVKGYGGGSGAGASQYISEQLKDSKKLISELSVHPFQEDGETKQERAFEWEDKMKSLSTVNYDIVVMDKVKEYHQSDTTLTTRDILDLCSLQIENSLRALISVINTKNTIQNIDFADIRTSLSGGNCLILTDQAKTLREAFEKAISQTRYRFDPTLDQFGVILLNVRSKYEILQTDLDFIYSKLKTKAGKQLVKFGHDTQVEHEGYEVQLVLGGKPEPITSTTLLYAPTSIRDRVSKLMKK